MMAVELSHSGRLEVNLRVSVGACLQTRSEEVHLTAGGVVALGRVLVDWRTGSWLFVKQLYETLDSVDFPAYVRMVFLFSGLPTLFSQPIKA